MSQPYIGEIKIFAGNFAIRGWAKCDGTLLPIAQNTALFSILGTTYGGDGRTTLGLPSLRGRAAMHEGTGPGLSPVRLGEKNGVESITLNSTQIPVHNHTGTIKVADGNGNSFGANGNYLASKAIDSEVNPNTSVEIYKAAASATFAKNATLDGLELGQTGLTGAHDNMQPSLTLMFLIALQGSFPSRS